ncbi:hypothetical protein FHW88_002511 [Mucilaginibacter sp. SG538B]|uniref:hypothetical protein n=1 Tax=Mucilaginibacter sp. SG538B TaxID=2587021 RepID=UPI00159DF9ED|nr:hypothetical protein [Mucilaginibacter sp. SG538B]NVM64183.1 hypothetical protein [Mucilaginibacter sp. SG538B]NVM64222.1 hypothetical protein [Mucilaginibacter sp. SG538B]
MKDTENTGTISSEALLERLRGANWEKLIKLLHLYSLNRLKSFPQLAERFDIKNLAYQFADEAIRQLWMEERVWNIVEYPDLYDFLKGAVDSIRYNFLKKKEVNATTYIDEVIEDTVPNQSPDPQQLLEAQELEAQIKEIFSDDLEAYQIFDCLLNKIPPRDIAAEMNMPVNQVYNTTKRIDRKLTELRKQLSN